MMQSNMADTLDNGLQRTCDNQPLISKQVQLATTILSITQLRPCKCHADCVVAADMIIQLALAPNVRLDVPMIQSVSRTHGQFCQVLSHHECRRLRSSPATVVERMLSHGNGTRKMKDGGR